MNESEKLKVVLADRDGFYLQKLKRCLERKGDMTVVGMTDSGPAVLEMVRKLNADVVLLDILLGDRDGFWVLESLKKLGSDCICILISAMDSDKLVRRAIGLGADYYMAKPIQGELLLERIHQLVDGDNREMQESIGSTKEEASIYVMEGSYHNLEADISATLSRMGISASIKGYHFIRRAIMMAVDNEEVLIGITKGLYPDIGKLFKTSASKVERAIRHAIESAWKKNGQQVYFEVVGYLTPDKPTNGQFIAALTEYFRIRQNEVSKKIS
ncbi:sporulation initiation factor Spo0A C-terminal domain-containing protein [Anaerotignum propionicum]|jgi:two-component system response regulator (stage 0 sporulation protein A)|uniref:Stage 0 sporulation protein A homolog n=1 Tax=Anaerotignum propionicum DSM 1682 TaxID=991789 RepID=A0A0X8VBN5_ANAPI|nr:sporulation initiation factor Spo0A C-terminal domain-containing protein [Anaerotignum propionicum]AMJ42044.1 stage 0 sporulation protein A [Anaerotignum propionicum DSM 1682]MEA5057033.1 sporulation initiation factor Spo0A C-terminal domain-containing protein [Anaerotignum propionicum]SHE50203.1 two-component system, response regulator, stage 0 sporulation protein A [[Clostridium] propionicum DSM 1682] [Anaerotignum propionicum DSM 1682]